MQKGVWSWITWSSICVPRLFLWSCSLFSLSSFLCSSVASFFLSLMIVAPSFLCSSYFLFPSSFSFVFPSLSFLFSHIISIFLTLPLLYFPHLFHLPHPHFFSLYFLYSHSRWSFFFLLLFFRCCPSLIPLFNLFFPTSSLTLLSF